MINKNSRITLTLVGLALFNAQNFYSQEVPKTIVYGTVYNIFHDRYNSDESFAEVVEKDMKGIKEANFNLVMPFPFGQWDTKSKQQDWKRTDILVDNIEKQGLMLMPILLKSTHRAYLPTWKWLDIPDAIREFPEISTSTEDVKYQHPKVLIEIENYFKSVAARYGQRNSLVGYNLWNEAHYNSIDEITIPKFRAWLKGKYGTLNELNRVWAEDYGKWDQITPLLSRNWESSMAAIDWDLFRYSNVGELAKWAYETMRKYDKEHFNAINTVGTLINNRDYSQWTVDGREIAPHTDIFGISFYPDKYMNEHKEPMPYWKYSSMFNVTRSDAGSRPFYLVEAQTNQQNGMGVFQFMSYNDIHLLSWIALAENSKGIIFWKWKPFYRGQQAFGRGLTMADGQLAPRGKAAKDVGAVLKKYGKTLFEAQIEPSQIGILYDVVTLQKSLEALHNPASSNTTDYLLNESFEGTYKALFDNHLTADVIRTDKPVTAKQLEQYKVLYLPTQMVIRKKIAGLLKEFVADGGWVVADARTGIMDEFDFGFEQNPGFGLDSLFGARRLDLSGGTATFEIKPTGNFFSNKPDSSVFKGVYLKEKIELLGDSEIIARFSNSKEPAIVTHKRGKGRAILISVPMGLSYYKGYRKTGDILANIALKAGVSPSLITEKSHEEIMARLHRTPKGESIVYIINTSRQDFNGKMTIPGITKAKKIMELTKEEKIDFENDSDQIRFNIKIPAFRARILFIQ